MKHLSKYLLTALCFILLMSFSQDKGLFKEGYYEWVNEQTGGRMALKVAYKSGGEHYSFMSDAYGKEDWSEMVRESAEDTHSYVVIKTNTGAAASRFRLKIPQQKPDEIQVATFLNYESYLTFKRK